MSYSVTLIKNVPVNLTAEETHAAEAAAMKILSQYPEWLLRAAYKDNMALLEEGVSHAERGESAWRRIEDEAREAALRALRVDEWHDPNGAPGIEVWFSDD